MFDQKRYEAEFNVLKSKLPDNAWTFRDLNGSRPYLAAAVKTRSGRLYTIQIELPTFPIRFPRCSSRRCCAIATEMKCGMQSIRHIRCRQNTDGRASAITGPNRGRRVLRSTKSTSSAPCG